MAKPGPSARSIGCMCAPPQMNEGATRSASALFIPVAPLAVSVVVPRHPVQRPQQHVDVRLLPLLRLVLSVVDMRGTLGRSDNHSLDRSTDGQCTPTTPNRPRTYVRTHARTYQYRVHGNPPVGLQGAPVLGLLLVRPVHQLVGAAGLLRSVLLAGGRGWGHGCDYPSQPAGSTERRHATYHTLQTQAETKLTSSSSSSSSSPSSSSSSPQSSSSINKSLPASCTVRSRSISCASSASSAPVSHTHIHT